MNRRRRQDVHLPPCVYRKHGAFWLVKANKWTRLGTDLKDALGIYAAKFEPSASSMPKLIDEAIAARAGSLSKNTLRQYKVVAKRLKRNLAEFAPEQVRTRDLAQIKDSLRGKPNMANRTITVLRIVFEHAIERQLVDVNPAVGLKRLVEKKRTRLLSVAEFEAIHAQAKPGLQVVMDLLRYTAQRIGDVLAIRHADLVADGIRFAQQKTNEKLTVAWSPPLRTAVDRAKSLHGNLRALTLLHDRRGKVLQYNAIRRQWDAACAAAGVEDANLHDLRAFALTRARQEGKDATALAGHRSAAQTERYLRDRVYKVVHGPEF